MDVIKRINELREEYKNKFGEQMPMFLVRHLDDEEIIKLMEDCIKNNKPYDPPLDKDSLY